MSIIDRKLLVPILEKKLTAICLKVQALANTEGPYEELAQRERIINELLVEFEREVTEMSQEQQALHRDLILSLRLTMEQFRVELKNAMESNLMGEDWGTMCQGSENVNDPILSDDDAVMPEQEGAVGGDTENVPTVQNVNENVNEIANRDQNVNKNENQIQTVNTKIGSVESRDDSQEEQMEIEENASGAKPLEKIEQQPVASDANSVTSAIVSAMNEDGFSYTALIMFNTALTEIQALSPMPEGATARDFRRMRNFIQRFLILCKEMGINFAYLLPIMLARVVACFDKNTFNNWQFFMMRNTATLRSMREFLAMQEEIKGDDWMKEGREKLAKAVSLAQEKQNQKRDSERKISSGSANPSRESEKKFSYAQTLQNQQGCSTWNSETGVKTPTNQVKPKVPANTNIASENTSQNSTAQPGRERDRSKNRDSKREGDWKCPLCNGKHALFYCVKYLSKTLERRWEFVQDKGICPLCLQGYHDVLECTDKRCQHCDGDAHNSTLCEVSIAKKKLQKKKE